MITTAEMQTRMEDPTADGALLKLLVEGAHAYVETQTRRKFRAVEEVTEYILGNGTRRLWLADKDAEDVAVTIAVTESQYPGATATTLTDGTDYEFRTVEGETFVVRLGAYVWKQGYEYAVTYSRGYEETTAATATSAAGIAAPDDIRDVVAGLAGLKYQMAGNEGLRSETIGGYSYTRFGEGDLDAIPGARETILSWRRPVLA